MQILERIRPRPTQRSYRLQPTSKGSPALPMTIEEATELVADCQDVDDLWFTAGTLGFTDIRMNDYPALEQQFRQRIRDIKASGGNP